MIDLQNTYTRGVMALEDVEPAIDEAAALLDRARSAGIPIVHVQHDAGEGTPYDVRDEIGAIVDRVAAARRRAPHRQELPELLRRHRPRRAPARARARPIWSSPGS